MMIVRVAVVAIFYLSFAQNAFAQDDNSDAAKGRELADSYLLDAELVLRDYYMVATLSVHTDGLAKQVLSSAGSMERLVEGKRINTRVSWLPKIHENFRSGESWDIHVFNTEVVREEGVLDREPFVLTNNALIHPAFEENLSNTELYRAACLHPFQFPIAYQRTFNVDTNQDSGGARIFKNFVCKKVKQDGNKFVTYWAPSDKLIRTVNVVTFEDGVIVEHEHFYSANAAEFEKYDYRSDSCRVVNYNKTKWGEFQGEKVPVEVAMFINNSSHRSDRFQVEGKISYFPVDSSECTSYKKKIEEVNKRVANLRFEAKRLLEKKR